MKKGGTGRDDGKDGHHHPASAEIRKETRAPSQPSMIGLVLRLLLPPRVRLLETFIPAPAR